MTLHLNHLAFAVELPGGGLHWAEERDRWLERLRAAAVPVRIEDPNGVTVEIETHWTAPAQADAQQVVRRHADR